MSDTVSIPKDEYIALLQAKATLLERELASPDEPPFIPRKPHSWMSRIEREEILRLAEQGFRSSEIGERLGRSGSTVRRLIIKHRAIAKTTPGKVDG